jgi:uridine phosphorylase
VKLSVPFPLHPRKHREEPLFTASEFHRYVSRRTGLPPPKPPSRVILVFGRRWRNYLHRKYRGRFDPRCETYAVADDVGVYLVGGPGAPYASIVVEELSALGARRFVIVGMAGSLQPELRVGSFVLCDKALRDEGTSHHYLKPGAFASPSPRLTAELGRTLQQERIPYVSGPTWTIDAPYRETITEIRRYRKQGILTVEMEASAVFAVAHCRDREAAALFVISDHLDERGWEPRFHDSRTGLRTALRIAISTLEKPRGKRKRPLS